MKTSVIFRNLDASDALKDHAKAHLDKLKKYFDEPAEAHIVLTTEKHSHKAEVTIDAHGLTMCGKESSEDMYLSIDRALNKIEKQIKKYKDKLVRNKPKNGSKRKMQFKLLESYENGEEQVKNYSSSIVETKEFTARPMLIDEAVMQMDLLDNDILVFLNAKTEEINILYRKKNNKYGLIEAHS